MNGEADGPMSPELQVSAYVLLRSRVEPMNPKYRIATYHRRCCAVGTAKYSCCVLHRTSVEWYFSACGKPSFDPNEPPRACLLISTFSGLVSNCTGSGRVWWITIRGITIRGRNTAREQRNTTYDREGDPEKNV